MTFISDVVPSCVWATCSFVSNVCVCLDDCVQTIVIEASYKAGTCRAEAYNY